MKKLSFLLALTALFVLGCVSADDNYLIKQLDDQGKSQALTSAGIDEYQLYIVRNKDYSQMDRIKEYFNAALRFDPTNAQAQQYLTLMGTYRTQQVKQNLAAANKILAKPKRTDDDTYQAVSYIQNVMALDPKNTDAPKLLSSISSDSSKLVQSYLDKAKASIASVDDKSTPAAREKAYTDAYASVGKALDMDPHNGAAQGMLNTLKGNLAKLIGLRVTAIQGLVGTSKFADARTQLNGLSDLNRKSGNSFDADVRTQTYAVNFAWAKAAFAQKDYTTSEARVDAALAVNRTAEASALKKSLTDLRSRTTDTGASFDAALADIDKAIAAGDLLTAHRKLDAVANSTTDQARLSQLDDRDQKIQDGLKPLYDDGVAAYQNEDFKTAIDKLSIVVEIKVDYGQAADYLDKAKAKQKLLDQS